MKNLLSLLLLLLTTTVFAQTGKISGIVTDKLTREPLIGANVFILGYTIGAATDDNGYFSIEKVPIGSHNLRISMLGYQTQVKPEIIVSPTNFVKLDVQLETSTVEIGGEVLVESSFFYKPSESPTSLQAFSYEEIRRAPGAVGDISRMIQTMPGVVQTTDQRNDLIVRGGSPSENLNLIDGFEIPNMNHFGNQGASGGPIGMLQTEFIGEANFYSGGFPSIYGDKMSSVLDVKLREGNSSRLTGNLEFSMAGAGGTFEGPIGKNTTFLINARRSYLDLINDAIGLTAVPQYSNINSKFTYKPTPENTFNFIALAGFDNIHFKNKDNDKTELKDKVTEEVKTNGYQYLVGGSWRHLFGKTGFGTLYLWGNINQYDVQTFDIYDKQTRTILPSGPLQFENISSEKRFGTKYIYSTYLTPQIEFVGGGTAKSINLNYNIFVSGGDTTIFGNIQPNINTNTNKNGLQADIFAQTVYKPTDDIKLTAGIRTNYFSMIDHSLSFDPRLGLSYSIFPFLTFNASAGIFHQSPELIWIYGNQTANTNLDFVRAVHTVAGFDFYPDSDIKITIEGYVKNYTNYPVSQSVPTFSMANSGDDYGSSGIESLVSNGIGKSMGLDIFLQKKLTDHFYGLISYSWSQTRHAALDGIERPGAFDIPHVFTISGGYKFDESMELSSKFRYVSGRPYTPINQVATIASDRMVLDLNRINESRYPDYLRLDVRFDHRTFFDNFTLVSFMEIENITDQKNIYMYMWNQATQKMENVYQYRFFFVGGFILEF